ncbi:MAG: hypothetical protein M1833_001087 [Piccolia ochrophora]|nr:MAG: hypothetical protein M1833_001087 [Piccolia ochrophora]
MHAFTWLLSTLAVTTYAHPTVEQRGGSSNDRDSWVPAVRNYFEAVGKEVANIKNTPSFPNPPACNLDRCQMPAAPTPLPPPSAGLKVVHVAIGRGTQNYTCTDATEASTPVAVGAVAALYNATCTAANYPEILAKAPNATLQFPTPSGESDISPAQLVLSGRHFFNGGGTPIFDLVTKRHSYGILFGAKNASSPAPRYNTKGQNNKGHGSVPWLKLTQKDGSLGFKEAYRVNTAGGNPPPNCKGIDKTFSIEYATE